METEVIKEILYLLLGFSGAIIFLIASVIAQFKASNKIVREIARTINILLILSSTTGTTVYFMIARGSVLAGLIMIFVFGVLLIVIPLKLLKALFPFVT